MIEQIQDLLNNPENLYNTTSSNDSNKFRDKVLLKCKGTLEKMQVELDDQRHYCMGLKEKNDQLQRENESKENDIVDAHRSQDEINLEYQKELEKVNNYQRENLNQKESLPKLQALEFKFNNLREKFNHVSNENLGLKSHVLKLEENLKSRDNLFQNWTETISYIDDKISKNDDELKVMTNERSVSKEAIYEIFKILKEKGDINDDLMVSKYSINTPSISCRNLFEDYDKNTTSILLGSLKKQISDYQDSNEEIRKDLMQKVVELSSTNEILKNMQNQENLDKETFEILKKELDIKSEDYLKYKSIVSEQTGMINSYKEMIEEQKLKNNENSQDICDLQNNVVSYQKDNEELQSILKLYEERLGNLNNCDFPTRDSSQQETAIFEKDEEINTLLVQRKSFEAEIDGKNNKIKLLKDTVLKLKEKLEIAELIRKQKNKEVETERDKKDEYKGSLKDLKKRIKDLECFYFQEIKDLKKDKQQLNSNTNKENDKTVANTRNQKVQSGFFEHPKPIEEEGKNMDVMQKFKLVINKFESKLKTIHTKLSAVNFNESEETISKKNFR